MSDNIWGLPGARVDRPIPGAEEFTTTPLHDLLRHAASRTPQAIALTSQSGNLRYAELLRLAQNAANSIAALVPPGRAVACLLPRTPEAMAGLLGCLIAGRLCLLLESTNPVERQATLLADAAPAALLVDQDPPFPPAAPVLMLRDALAGPDRDWRPDHAWDPDAPFAVHFTSGSTGRPKGIVLSARSVLYRGLDFADRAGLGCDDRVYGNAVHAGAHGLATLLVALARGANVVLANIADVGAGAVLRLLEREAVTNASAPPQVLRVLFQMDRARRAFSAMRVLRVGAGSVSMSDLAAWRALLPPTCRIQHTYASTEALVMAQWFVPADCSGEAGVLAAGMIQPNHDYAILDGDCPVPFGDSGELILRSQHLALGEWQDGQLVAGRLTPAPGRPGWRIFRTGDLVRLQADGMLRVVGRADRQVKINGVRVEPAEIEAVLRTEPAVLDAAVVADAGATSVSLHGFVAATDINPSDLIAALRQRLAATLPPALRPSRLTVLDRLPTLPGGKIDLVALSRWPAR